VAHPRPAFKSPEDAGWICRAGGAANSFASDYRGCRNIVPEELNARLERAALVAVRMNRMRHGGRHKEAHTLDHQAHLQEIKYVPKYPDYVPIENAGRVTDL
jgi:hypothetical protein